MKVFIGALLLFISLVGYAQVEEDSANAYINRPTFKRGEFLEYKATFGIFTVGKGTFQIQPTLHKVKNRICYKLDSYGKTSGFVDWLAGVDDHWGAYVDTSSLVTHIAYRTLVEGKYRKNEVVYFDFDEDSIRVKDFDFERSTYNELESFSMERLSREFMSGFLYLRTVDFNELNKGDTVEIYSFLEDTFYDFKIVMWGREVLKTKAGKFKSIKFIPVMPNNNTFEDGDSIIAWFSDDENKIPLKVEAKMFIGHAGIELISYDNLSKPPGIVD
ncbi:MAG: DUF3108 domain-containing protein [Cyclobacteriaceae bacterium]|nr:DUF3108 domain-containing protein [Cyclobacteriaceae bacterium]